MAKTAMIRVRVEPQVKQDAETIFSSLGLSATEAITLFYKQIALCRGLPFDVRIPSIKTREAVDQANTRKESTRYRSVDDLVAEIDD